MPRFAACAGRSTGHSRITRTSELDPMEAAESRSELTGICPPDVPGEMSETLEVRTFPGAASRTSSAGKPAVNAPDPFCLNTPTKRKESVSMKGMTDAVDRT